MHFFKTHFHVSVLIYLFSFFITYLKKLLCKHIKTFCKLIFCVSLLSNFLKVIYLFLLSNCKMLKIIEHFFKAHFVKNTQRIIYKPKTFKIFFSGTQWWQQNKEISRYNSVNRKWVFIYSSSTCCITISRYQLTIYFLSYPHHNAHFLFLL